MYLANFVIFLGISSATAPGVIILISTVFFILAGIYAPAEERYCIRKYDALYCKYLNSTTKWIGILKSERLDLTAPSCEISNRFLKELMSISNLVHNTNKAINKKLLCCLFFYL